MKTLLMTLKERDRLAMFRQVRDRSMTLIEASRRLGLSYRQAKRLWQQYRAVGDAGLVHGLRGRSSNNQRGADLRRDRAVALCQEHYAGFGPTLAAEQLAERDGLVVDHETLRGWLISAGLWKPRRHVRRRHPRRTRRSCFGELVQFDGSDHHWFDHGRVEDQARHVLMVMVDDATGLTHARFFAAETTAAAMLVFKQWAERYGLPRALYPDRHSIYRRNDKAADEAEHRTGRRPLTRFGEALHTLGVELICAHSPQAKGRVERMNSTLQDRLVKLLKLEGITTIDAANAYLDDTFLPAHNVRFAVEPGAALDAHRPAPAPAALDAALCPVRERRAVDRSGTVSWRGRCFELIGPDAASRRRQVLVRVRLDGQVQLLDLTDGRVLDSREVADRRTPAQPKASLVERVAAHAEPSKPSSDHPWRKSLAVAGSVTARCARLHCAGHRDTPNQGTLLLS